MPFTDNPQFHSKHLTRFDELSFWHLTHDKLAGKFFFPDKSFLEIVLQSLTTERWAREKKG
jgi:hypothetical protein